jgi:molybdate transport system substrate-binding protein
MLRYGPLAALLLLTGCLPSPAPPSATAGAEITLFAASSLTDAFTELAAAFERSQPGTRVTFNFGSSSQLRAQLEQGAHADLFASADEAQMTAARAAGVLVGEPRVFAYNRLTIVVPRDNPRRVEGVRDLAQPGLKFVTSQLSVPIGQYTLAMLDRASADPTFGPDFRARVERNIVSREDNVRQIVAKVQLGEADAGVVYTSDVTPRVRDLLVELPIPDGLNSVARYPIAVARGANEAAAQAFIDYVLSPPGQEILARWGFHTLDSPP